MSKAIEFLQSHQSGATSKWRADAEWRRDNEFWLTYSRHITLQVLRGMDEQSVTQAELARRMGCTQQYVSNLLKGSSNMTLETIARLETALNLDILKTALADIDKYAGYLENRTGGYRQICCSESSPHPWRKSPGSPRGIRKLFAGFCG